MTTFMRQLQKNTKFRKILKQHKIGWRRFVKYSDFGMAYPVDSVQFKQAVCMGKWNGQYDYFICHIIKENKLDENGQIESILIDVVEN